ncbi:MAG: cytochrome b/b6 domain-containing protein [Chloroflexota bacterium]
MAARAVAPDERIIPNESRVLRQPLLNRLIHWAVAIAIFSLFISGFGQMPIFKRYGVADLPGMAWMANYAITLAIHYLATALLLFAGAFHLVYHGLRRQFGLWPRRGDVWQSLLIVKAMLTGGKEPPSHKYLPEQRLAYAFIGANVAVLVVSGAFKVADNLPGIAFAQEAAWLATTFHNVSMLLLFLGIAGHLIALLIPANRHLVGGIFHGKVSLAYVEERHCLWCEQLRETAPEPATEEVAEAGPVEQVVAPAPAPHMTAARETL